MNRYGVAMAADSAATSFGGRKIYRSNKLFMLSKHHPVGIMIYGAASFVSVPWESIIKEFRKIFKDESKATLKEYCQEFIEYLNTDDLFTKEMQDTHFKVYINYCTHKININIQRRIEDYVYTHPSEFSSPLLDPKDLKLRKISDNFIKEAKKMQGGYKYCKNSDIDLFKKIKLNEEKRIEKIIEDYSKTNRNFFTDASKKILIDILINSMVKLDPNLRDGDSGIVIGGFGEKDFFPSVSSFAVHFYYDSSVIIYNEAYKSITSEIPGRVLPFAQRDVISNFMEGVSPDYFDFVRNFLYDFVKKYPNTIDKIKSIDDKIKKVIKNTIKKDLSKIIPEFENAHKRSVYLYNKPMLEAVSALPKDELGVFAETLVNLTSLKRKVSADESESVGGPTDVAVISKGDGFVWIKRKHYFDPKLNMDYIRNLNKL